jgi:BirA family biotin operon repressor/biotin-[acetyl-CoA-carboxylase] ligase
VAIVGVGVNVSTPATALAEAGLGGAATSLREACAQVVDRGELLLAFVRRVDHWLTQPVSELFAVWQTRLWGRGQRLRMFDLGREEEVLVLGVGPDGSLRVRLADGTERHTVTGELIV